MAVILDTSVHTAGETRGLSWRKKIHLEAIRAMYGLPEDAIFDMYDFQDDPTLVGAMNKGTGGVLGNMAWDNIALRTGDGWYVPPQIPGAYGFGMTNPGGAGAHYGSVSAHNGNSIDAREKATFLFKFKMNGTGGGGAGRIGEAGASYIIFASAANTIAVSIYDGAAWHTNTTGANVTYGYWHDLAVVYDGSLVGDANRCKIYLDGIDVTTVTAAGMPAMLVDPGDIRYILNCAATFNRAWDGELGFYAVCPDLAMSQAQVRSLIESRGLFQPTAANRPAIPSGPGPWGPPCYSYDGAADPNSDCLVSFQALPIKTAQGTVIVWFTPEDMVNQQTIFGISEYGSAAEDELAIHLRGDIANDPIEWHCRLGGAVDFRLQIPFGATYFGVPTMVWFTSDGSTVRGGVNGEESVVAAAVGANNGQWFDHATDANVICAGASPLNTYQNMYKGRESKVVALDEPLSPLEIARIGQSSGLGWQRQFGT